MITLFDYADLFTIPLRNDDVQEFGARWDVILLSVTKIAPDDVLVNGKQKDSVREEISVVSGTTKISVQNQGVC